MLIQVPKTAAAVDGTVALGCAVEDVQWAVQVKREIGRIWEDIDSGLYKAIFNASVPSTRLWRAVQVMRVVDGHLSTLQRRQDGRRRQAGVHGNRLLLHGVHRCLPRNVLEDIADPIDTSALASLVDELFEAMEIEIEKSFEPGTTANMKEKPA